MRLKNSLKALNQFVAQYAFVLILVGAAAYYFLSENVYLPNPKFANSVMESANFNPYSRGNSLYSAQSVSGNTPASRSTKMAVSDYLMPPIVEAQGFDPSNLEDRKIIKDGSMQLEVENPEESLTIVEAELFNQKAYITHQDSWEVRRGTLAYNLTIRVPAENLEILTDNLGKLGLKKSENFSTADITAQYRDTANRIKNLTMRRDRLRVLMERETETITDVLEIDRELSNVQDEMDRLMATQKTRDTDVAYSTLRLTLNPQAEIGDFSSPDWNLESSWKTTVNDFIFDARDVVDKLIRAFVYTPIWLPMLLILWGIKRWLFGGKKEKAKTKN